MVEEDRCVLCNGEGVEDIKHFVLEFEEFEQNYLIPVYPFSISLSELILTKCMLP